MDPITDRNPNANFIDYIFGGWQRYRRWRGGYWWYSTFTYKWWRHKPEPTERVEDYR